MGNNSFENLDFPISRKRLQVQWTAVYLPNLGGKINIYDSEMGENRMVLTHYVRDLYDEISKMHDTKLICLDDCPLIYELSNRFGLEYYYRIPNTDDYIFLFTVRTSFGRPVDIIEFYQKFFTDFDLSNGQEEYKGVANYLLYKQTKDGQVSK